MSKVTKTILILQLDSWIAAHSGASCCALSTSSLLSVSTSTVKHTHPRRPRRPDLRCRNLSEKPSDNCNAATLFSHQETCVELHLKGPVPADRVRVAHRARCLAAASCRARQQLLFEPGRISVLPCCPNSQWLHFIQTLAWSHSNQEDPASLCWAGKRRQGRGQKKKKRGWSEYLEVESGWQLGGSSLVQTHILVLEGAKCSSGSVSTGCSEVENKLN